MPLRILVQTSCEIDPTLNVRIDRATGEVLPDAGDELLRVAPAGRSGVAAALRIPHADVTTFCVGESHEAALRHALAAGAHRAVMLAAGDEHGAALGWDALVAWVRSGKFDLVIADRMAPRLAVRLGAAHLAGVSDLRFESGKLLATRHLGRGDREEVSSTLPAIVRIETNAGSPPYVSRSRLQAVAALAIERVMLTPAEAEPPVETGPLQAARPRTRTGQTTTQPAARGMDRLQALMSGSAGSTSPSATKGAAAAPTTPEQMAEQFVRYLKHHDLL